MQSSIIYTDRSDLEETLYEGYLHDTHNLHPIQELWALDIMTNGSWGLLEIADRDLALAIPYNAKIPGVRQIYMPQLLKQIRLLGKGSLTDQIVHETMLFLQDHFRRGVIAFPKYDSNKGIEIERSTWRLRNNFEIDLNDSYLQINDQYKSKFRGQLKSVADQLSYSSDLNVEDFMSFYRKHSSKKRPITEEGFLRIEQLIRKALEEEKGVLRSVCSSAGQLESIGFWLVNTSYLFFAVLVSRSEARKLYAAHYLVDQVFAEYSGSEKIHDFGGSDMPGVALWMSHFKPLNNEYIEYSYDFINPLYKSVISGVKSLQMIIKK